MGFEAVTGTTAVFLKNVKRDLVEGGEMNAFNMLW